MNLHPGVYGLSLQFVLLDADFEADDGNPKKENRKREGGQLKVERGKVTK